MTKKVRIENADMNSTEKTDKPSEKTDKPSEATEYKDLEDLFNTYIGRLNPVAKPARRS